MTAERTRPKQMRQVEPYTELAPLYDFVMDHVDYEAWADYVDTLLDMFGDEVTRILELGGGTGVFAEELLALRRARYVLTDLSEAMLSVAASRFKDDADSVSVKTLDFTRFAPSDVVQSDPFDAVLLLYDGFNYASTDDEARTLLDAAAGSLREGGVFIFDQATPVNSENNAEYFEDSGTLGEHSYHRTSAYDAESRMHVTTFEIDGPGGTYKERHEQRIWSYEEAAGLIADSPFDVAAAYDGFSLDPAHGEAERIHWILRR